MLELKYKFIVIKLGTGILSCDRKSGRLNLPQLVKITSEIAKISKQGAKCIIVSSGAVGAGLNAFKLNNRPSDLTSLQACASVGQAKLMHSYETFFKIYDLSVAQILLTHSDLATKKRRKNISDTINFLLKHPSIIPIINENDPVAADEIKFGDNDFLAVEVAELMNAELVIMLTAEDGLKDLKKSKTQIIKKVNDIKSVEHLACPNIKGVLSVGGMHSKLQAVKKSLSNNIPVVIGNGYKPERLFDYCNDTGHATFFYPQK